MTRPTGIPALRAGTARTDVTPADLAGLNAMGEDFTAVEGRLLVRAVVVDGGTGPVAIVAADLLEFGRTDALRARIETETGIPASAVLLCASHSHNAPRAGLTPPGGLSRDPSPESLRFTEALFDAVAVAVAAAHTRLEPVTLAFGTGTVSVNQNRDELVDGRWMLGTNPGGPSDKTLGVLALNALDGRAVATLLTYAVHPTVSLGTRRLGPDLAGAATAAVEAAVGGEALWLPGSIGDQAPAWSLEIARDAGDDPTAADVAAHVAELGAAVGSQAIAVREGLHEWTDAAPVAAAQIVVGCRPKRGTHLAPGMSQEHVDEVELIVTAAVLGDAVLIGVSGEVTCGAAAVIAAASPVPAIVLSIVNERIGYLADADAFRLGTFAARGCPVQADWVDAVAAAAGGLVRGLVA
ncbi:MAG: hypothetical protein QM626_04880 [Microbacterium sp.]|uniref:hypothetical protein n=1 Tax=Microbacterium sp. TaxID=51671 RepID=UPI0039E62E21